VENKQKGEKLLVFSISDPGHMILEIETHTNEDKSFDAVKQRKKYYNSSNDTPNFLNAYFFVIVHCICRV